VIKLIASSEGNPSINKLNEIGRNLLCRTLILTPYLGHYLSSFLHRNFMGLKTDVNMYINYKKKTQNKDQTWSI